jgi:hypothetical protein
VVLNSKLDVRGVVSRKEAMRLSVLLRDVVESSIFAERWIMVTPLSVCHPPPHHVPSHLLHAVVHDINCWRTGAFHFHMSEETSNFRCAVQNTKRILKIKSLNEAIDFVPRTVLLSL